MFSSLEFSNSVVKIPDSQAYKIYDIWKYMTLEDEYHFVLECTLYGDLRKQYISKYYWNHPGMLKFVQLSSENEKIQKNLSWYIFKAFKVRGEIFYN